MPKGLPARTTAQVRADVERSIDRAVATHRLPTGLESRWRRAVDGDEMWRFESTVVLGGAGAASFLFEDLEGVPTVTGLLEWHGLSIGDPATDLQWLASAPAAADDVYAAYVSHSGRAPRSLPPPSLPSRARERARLYAELEFAKWLVHGHDSDRDDIIADAIELLEALAAGVAGEHFATDAALDVDDAIALLDRTPDATPSSVDTSMHTDAYDPEELAQWLADEHEDDSDAPSEDDGPHAEATSDATLRTTRRGTRRPRAPTTRCRRHRSSCPFLPQQRPSRMTAMPSPTPSARPRRRCGAGWPTSGRRAHARRMRSSPT